MPALALVFLLFLVLVIALQLDRVNERLKRQGKKPGPGKRRREKPGHPPWWTWG
jgi:hypothetical protein